MEIISPICVDNDFPCCMVDIEQSNYVSIDSGYYINIILSFAPITWLSTPPGVALMKNNLRSKKSVSLLFCFMMEFALSFSPLPPQQ